ncbi:DUF3859 domain-containing protein [Anabaena cylindrica FACHB-243]|uniref:DUF3859 domain-containing protein n=1 Tax=Anabaena cylindrica (strain ATCC 27899 / PCC 7122) TaxID=272123 RepID=K9ZDV6_ANACC|nr:MULTISPECIES: hypothetical protein [Anabaena]AFZ57393.1 hypothetical protein Anacy_1905 [Anabaena cylindrica PCC 7122]MBD2421075.1 DUF3859 domain-containing protein [Anabaena cylindrica FACHB-243]MBY5284951.1 DUF3859 domain-containing protein [Anabaena sp. CCAP 1446/1C]MBY5306355.1 DUF3859 domain-containing protein [Anabaena sp. CCAP 1446/1C]MCM2405828.1 DUF3859 domain-containing protein [Anabaena sp. CCAP 1446/1C]
MNQRLTQEQLNKIIAEVQGLQLRREAELDQQQVREILQDLNLAPELLDEALIQLRRRQALEVQQRRNKLIISGVVAVVIAIIASTIFFNQQQTSLLTNVSAQQDRITLADNANLQTISRQTNPEVFYRVALKDAPIGKKLSLACNWIDPSGLIVKQNKYQTREVKTSPWDTYCRYTINSAAPVGDWKVEMFLEGRKISDETFAVQ